MNAVQMTSVLAVMLMNFVSLKPAGTFLVLKAKYTVRISMTALYPRVMDRPMYGFSEHLISPL